MTAYARKDPGKTAFYVVKLVRLEKKLKSQVQKWLEFWPLNLDYRAFMTFLGSTYLGLQFQLIISYSLLRTTVSADYFL